MTSLPLWRLVAIRFLGVALGLALRLPADATINPLTWRARSQGGVTRTR
jgi:hypothetical protein